MMGRPRRVFNSGGGGQAPDVAHDANDSPEVAVKGFVENDRGRERPDG